MFITAKFLVPNMGASAVLGKDGVAVVAHVQDGLPTLVLLVDMQERNAGASLTNSAEKAVSFFRKQVQMVHGKDCFEHAEWIEVDSMGCFDRMALQWDSDECVDVVFSGLHNAGNSRNTAAFIGQYGARGEELLKRDVFHGLLFR